MHPVGGVYQPGLSLADHHGTNAAIEPESPERIPSHRHSMGPKPIPIDLRDLEPVGETIQSEWGPSITPVVNTRAHSNHYQPLQQHPADISNAVTDPLFTLMPFTEAATSNLAPPAPFSEPASPSEPQTSDPHGYQDPANAHNWIVARPAKLKWTKKKEYIDGNTFINGHNAVSQVQTVKCLTCEKAGTGRACIKLIGDPARVFPGNTTGSAGSLRCSFCVGRNQKCEWPVPTATNAS